MKTDELYSLYLNSNKVCTDTRKIAKNDLFFALKGENFNGNTFAEQALKDGASYAIIDEAKFKINERTILVDDVLQTLQKLANHHRSKLKTPIIGLTGSNGKTTTKELINAVLSKRKKTVATMGNLNNHIGVPLTLLSMDSSTEIGIVEMGANHLKEIDFLCAIAEPDYGYITNFGKAHLEGFGSIEGVINAKSELYNHLKQKNKHIFYNADDTIQVEKLKGYPNKFGFGASGKSDVNVELLGADPFVKIKIDNSTLTSKLIGTYNHGNIAIAAAIGIYFNIPIPLIKEAIESYVPSNNRSQIIEKSGLKIILDAYNANPSSMKAALENFANLTGKNKLAILGDMFELGDEAEAEHQYIADFSSALNIGNTILVGKNFYKTNSDHQKFETFDDLKAHLSNQKLKDKTILIKGSRGMALERVLEIL